MGRDSVPGFAEVIRQRREELGLSLQAVAELSGTHQTSLSKLETGQRAPSLRLAAAIAIALGLTVNDLLELAAKQAALPERAKGKRK